MGDRVLMQVFSSKSKEFGPVCYGHWCGSASKEICEALAKRMAGRTDDVEYASARLIQEMVRTDKHSTGFGCWNASSLLTAGDSHGDAGVVLIDCANGFKCTCLGGYLTANDEGFPEANP